MQADSADRRTFVLDDAAWVEMQARLAAPPRRLPEVAALLTAPTDADDA